MTLKIALWSDLKLIDAAANGRTANAIRVMQLEGEMRENPELRADIFIQRWQALDRQRRLLCATMRLRARARSLIG